MPQPVVWELTRTRAQRLSGWARNNPCLTVVMNAAIEPLEPGQPGYFIADGISRFIALPRHLRKVLAGQQVIAVEYPGTPATLRVVRPVELWLEGVQVRLQDLHNPRPY